MQSSISLIPQQNSGFTLVELMATLAVAAIAIVLATPSFTNVLLNNRLVGSHNLILTALASARSEAITRGTTITICASNNGAVCNTNDWEQGWIIFSDYNADRIIDAGTNGCLDGEDCVLRLAKAISNDITIRNSIFTNAGWLQYNSQGAIDSAGTFTICDQRSAKRASAININYIGHARKAMDSDDPVDSIVNDLDGVNIVCP